MMPTTIESLELEVQSSATSATGGIDSLSASLSKLKNAVKGGVGLTSVANQLNNLNVALKGVDGSSADKLDKLSTSLSKLSGLGQIKISSSIANQLTSIGTAATSLNGVDFSGIEKLGTALTPLSSLGKSNLSTFISQLGKIPALTTTIAPVIGQFTSQMNQLSNAVAPLAGNLNTVSAAMAKLPTNVTKTVTATNALAVANNTASRSYVNLWAKCRMAKNAIMSVARVISSWITESNSYIENVNLFAASMGEYASEAQKYAESISESVGIDPGQFMRYQGVFMTITKGFGIASDRAYTMSQNLTRLGYDLASLENDSFETAMQRIQSGIAGELEPLRRYGYDLSVARLQQEALKLGIDKTVASMTQAEKAELRYYAIMTQVTWAQGDLVRTLDAPANQLRILQAQVTQCARAFGNIFIPILVKVLPYAIVLAKVIRQIAEAIATLFHFALPEVDYSSLSAGSSALGDMADSAGDTAGGLGDATKAAKKLKNALLGIDELNIISPTDPSSGGTGTGTGAGTGVGVGGAGGLGIDLPTYEWADVINEKVQAIMDKIQPFIDWIKEHMDEILTVVEAIGVAFLAWKLANGIIDALRFIKGLKDLKLNMSFSIKAAGLAMFLADLKEFMKYLDDFKENGATFHNVAGMISEFAGMAGDALIILGAVKIGGALKVVQGIGEIAVAIEDISENGVNWDNAVTAIRGMTNVAIGIGLLTGHLDVAGWSLAIQGFVTVIDAVKDSWEAIKTGDWANVEWGSLAIGCIEMIAGVALAMGTLSKVKQAANLGDAVPAVQELTTTTTSLDTSIGDGSSGLTGKLTSLVKNLALGVVIVAEVAAAALLITGAIILLGMELEQVGIAWQPVIDNGATVAIAMGIGTGILVAIGVVTAALGTLGGAVVGQIAIGIAILAELGVAAGLFIVEIWAIGKGLDEVGKAWQPVLDNGETIATGIGLGTDLLVAIGVVTAALGVATVASAGLLPLAIGLGTALLVELAEAFIIFTESLVAVADELSNNLSPSLEDLNGKLPGLSSNMSDFVDFMTEFAGQVVRYTEVSAIAGIAATIDTIIGWFTEDPIDKLADDVNDIYSQTKTLNEKLNLAVPELKTARDLLKDYQGFLAEIQSLTDSNVDLNNGQFANMKAVGEKIVTGFVEGIKSKSSDFSNTATTIVSGFTTQLTTSAATSKTSFTTWATNLKNWFTQSGYGAINSTTFEGYAKNVVTGFKTGITNNYSTSKSCVTTWADYIKKWFSDTSYGNVSKTQWETYAKNVVTGFSGGISSNYSTAKLSMTTFANSVKSWFEKPDGTNLLSSQFYNIGRNVIQGFINGVNSLWDSAMKRIKEFGEEVIKKGKEGTEERSPSKAFKQIGSFVIEGFNIGISDMMGTSFKIMDEWLTGVTAFAPIVSMVVDTSAIDNFNHKAIADNMYAQVRSNYNNTVAADGFGEGMEETLRKVLDDYRIPQMVDDMKRQADKEEQTIVQVGNRTVTDAVTTQKKANGYVFAT